jgi:glycosyltransferase involved in cell wall biosynthesis
MNSIADRPISSLITIDDSLSLINRTGAYFIARELVQEFASISRIRRWRTWGSMPRIDILRKIIGRLMLKELEWLSDKPSLLCPTNDESLFSLYLDPLYVLRNKLESRDVVLCHDIGPISHPHLYYPETIKLYNQAYRKIAETKPGVVFVSETSRREFARVFGDDFRFLESIPLYLRNSLSIGEAEPVSGIGKRFLLTVGALECRKNHKLTIEAYRDSKFIDRGIELVICGSKGDAAEQIHELSKQIDGVTVLGYVSDMQLRWLYQQATAFVLPSQFEGFGMPALEAAAFGLPLVISQDSAMMEAVNGLGVAVDHQSSTDIARGIESILSMDSNQRQTLSERLINCAAQSSQEVFLQRWRKLIIRETSSRALFNTQVHIR